MSGIHFILTGGTIDSSYNPSHETAEPNDVSVIPGYIESVVKPSMVVSFDTICMKDSSDITDDIRAEIANAIRSVTAKHIVITHGTNTMSETADYLKSNLGDTDKTIVLVGSMIPLREFAQSDAGFNLGYAVAQVQTLDPGVYICMNAKSFPAGTVVKNFDQARFEDKA